LTIGRSLCPLFKAAAKILNEGETIHGPKDYCFSTEVLTVHDIARILSNTLGTLIQAEPRLPEQVFSDMGIDEQHAESALTASPTPAEAS